MTEKSAEVKLLEAKLKLTTEILLKYKSAISAMESKAKESFSNKPFMRNDRLAIEEQDWTLANGFLSDMVYGNFEGFTNKTHPQYFVEIKMKQEILDSMSK